MMGAVLLGAVLAIQLFSIPSHFPQEMHFLVVFEIFFKKKKGDYLSIPPYQSISQILIFFWQLDLGNPAMN